MINAVYFACICYRLAIHASGGALIAPNARAIAGSAVAAIVLDLPGMRALRSLPNCCSDSG